MAALEYAEYPKWLEHPQSEGLTNRFPPVLVYDPVQEEEYRAKGYAPPGKVDPHAYLLAKVTEKLDTFLTSLQQDLYKKIEDGLKYTVDTLIEDFRDNFAEGFESRLSAMEGFQASIQDQLQATVDQVMEVASDEIREWQAKRRQLQQEALEPRPTSDIPEPPKPAPRMARRFAAILDNWRKLRGS